MADRDRRPEWAITTSPHVAIVTGANHGIGAATAVALAAAGCDVLASYRRSGRDPHASALYNSARAAGADDTLAAAARSPGGMIAVEADLTDTTVIAELFDHAERELGSVDVLVNNASGWMTDTFAGVNVDALGRPLRPVTATTFERNFAVDALASALLIAELARRHVARGATWGRIVGLTSGGPQGFPGEVSYGAAKAALENYTMSASTELAPHGITANVVHPPVTDTGWITEEVRAFVAASPDHVHIVQPAEVAEVVAWLCTDSARLVTGNVIRMR